MDDRKLAIKNIDEMEDSSNSNEANSEESVEGSPTLDNPLSPDAPETHSSPVRSESGSSQKTSPEEQNTDDDSMPASAKRKRTESKMDESDSIQPESSSDGSPGESEVEPNQEASRSSSGEQTEDDGTMPASAKRKRTEPKMDESDSTPPESSSDGSPGQSEVEPNQEAYRSSSGEQTEDDGTMPASAKRKRTEPKIDESDSTPPESSSDGSPGQSEVEPTREASSSSSGEQTEDDGTIPASAKRKRPETSESGSDESLVDESLQPSAVNKSPTSRKARKTVTSSPRAKALQSSVGLPPSSNKKRKIMESGSCVSKDGSKSQFTSDTEHQSRLNLQDETEAVGSNDQKCEASNSSQSSPDYSESIEESSNRDDLNENEKLHNLPREEYEPNIHSSISPNPSSVGLNKDSIMLDVRPSDSDSSSGLGRYSPERVVDSSKVSYTQIGRPSTSDIFDPSVINKSSKGIVSKHEWCLVSYSMKNKIRFPDAFTVLNDTMKVISKLLIQQDKLVFERFKSFMILVEKYYSSENYIYLQTQILSYLSQRKEVTYSEDSYECFDAYACDILIRTAFLVFYCTLLDRSCINFGAIMRNYKTFKILYGNCTNYFEKCKKDKTLDTKSKKYIDLCENLELMYSVFKKLLVHIRKHAGERSIKMYAQQVWEEDLKYFGENIE